jgi:hypothetical protein
LDLQMVSFPLPKRRRPYQDGPKRTIAKVDRQFAVSLVNRAFHECLKSVIHTIVMAEEKKKKQLCETEFAEAMNKLKLKLSSGKKSPRDVFHDADAIGNYPVNTVYNSIGPGHDLVVQWHNCVQQNFPEVLEGGWNTYKQMATLNSSMRQKIPMPDTLRSVTVSLKSILRTDLPDEHRHLFTNRMQATSIQLTEVVPEDSPETRESMQIESELKPPRHTRSLMNEDW